MLRSLVGSEMCIRDRVSTQSTGVTVALMAAKKAESVAKIKAMRFELDTLKGSMSDLQDELRRQTQEHTQSVQSMVANIVQAFASVNASTMARAERDAVAMRDRLETLELSAEEAQKELCWDCPECNYPNTQGVQCEHCDAPHPEKQCSDQAIAFAAMMEEGLEQESEEERADQTQGAVHSEEDSDEDTVRQDGNTLFEGEAVTQGSNALFGGD
eukprot:TRINITY_DN4941_c0_g3_i3.p1 TRINITY_DN4941_c0_g3~~TRINITY_DN4941_c0_g3_i3.p1  ORF type:complete len:234 (-),score=103.70 TRINITY_DN4941_c0_g3_i3:91-732(-)